MSLCKLNFPSKAAQLAFFPERNISAKTPHSSCGMGENYWLEMDELENQF